MTRALILAAPASGSGKTTLTLGLLRALRNAGHGVRGAKSGPDYIDPRFHAAACGLPCVNLDAWAMPPARLHALAEGSDLLLIEGAMGLFDGAPPDGRGATADLARLFGAPVVLIVDAAHVAQSVAPIVAGFAGHDPAVRVAGVILNKVGSARHEAILRRALAPLGLPLLGAVRRTGALTHPSRHLGLVQAGERADLDAFIEEAASIATDSIDIGALAALATPLPEPPGRATPLPPPGQRIAVADDAAFAFAYPHLLDDWRRAGAEVTPFSPLGDEAPRADADFVFLPGGYPELHAGRLAAGARFRQGMQKAARAGTTIYGECGGYMVLGESLTDASGTVHPMLGLLALQTSFAKRKLHLGYRRLEPLAGPFATPLAGHEFHYATTLHADGRPLFRACDAEGNDLGPIGLASGNVSGSFAHVIDRAD